MPQRNFENPLEEFMKNNGLARNIGDGADAVKRSFTPEPEEVPEGSLGVAGRAIESEVGEDGVKRITRLDVTGVSLCPKNR